MNALVENTLTIQESISYLIAGKDEIMKGSICARGKCPVCSGKFAEIKKVAFFCPKHKTVPKRLYIDFYYNGHRYKLFSDRYGQVLDSYQRAETLLVHINGEVERHTFDPTHYIKQELEKFYTDRLLDGFLEYKLSSNKIAPSYVSHYRRHVGIAKEYFKSKDIRDLRKLDIVNYTDHVRKTYKFGNKTLRNCVSLFKTFLFYLKNDLEILKTVPHFPIIEITQPAIQWLTPEVQKVAFGHIPGQDKPIIAFLMLSGCRPGEARALKCKDVNIKQETITISATFSDHTYQRKRKGQGSKNAIIPIHPELMHFIKNRVENNLSEAFVFVNPNSGLHYSKTRLATVWSNARVKAGLDKSIRLYDATRHSFASQLVNSGVSIFSISKLLGHADIRTSEIYSHGDVRKLKVDVSGLSLEEKISKLKSETL